MLMGMFGGLLFVMLVLCRMVRVVDMGLMVLVMLFVLWVNDMK